MWVAVAAVLVAFVPGCRFSGLAFREDDRLEIVSPRPRSTVQLPVELNWKLTDEGRVAGEVAGYAVFVDISPMPPGEGFDHFAKEDPQCLRDPDCPDDRYLRSLGIYRTSGTSLILRHLGDTRPEEQGDTKERHEITISLLDGDDRRIGESAFYVDFFLDRRGGR